MTSFHHIAAISGLLLLGGLTGHADDGRGIRPVITGDASMPVKDLRPVTPAPTLRITNVRLEAAPADAPRPSTVLKFEITNEAVMRVTDVTLEIAIVEKQNPSPETSQPRVLVGPFTIRESAIIEPGYTVVYEIRLNDFAPNCECMANVRVLSVRSLLNADS